MKKNIIWLILATLITTCANADEWRIVAGRARDIAIGANGKVWVAGTTPTGGGFTIQTWNGSNWETIDGGAVRIAADPNGNPWVINNANQIFRRTENRWVEMPGRAVDIGIGADGSVWMIGTGTPEVNFWDGASWVSMGAAPGAARISVGPNGQPFIVTAAGVIKERIPGADWKVYPGTATDISIGANGSLWVIGRIPRLGSYSIHKWNVDNWEEVDGGGTQIAVDPAGKPWISNDLFEIYKRNYTPPSYNSRTAITPIVHDYPYTGTIATIAVNPANQNHVLAASGGGVFETFNARADVRTWTFNESLDNPTVQDLVFAWPPSLVAVIPRPGRIIPPSPIAWAAVRESFRPTTVPQIWEKTTTGTWQLAGFVAGTNIATAKTGCHRVIRGAAEGTYYACGDFGIAFYGPKLARWQLIDFPANEPVYSMAALKNGTIAAGTASGIYIYTPAEARWVLRNAATKLTDATQRYQLNQDMSKQVILFVNLNGATPGIQYTTDGSSWYVLNAPPAYAGAAGGFASVYMDSLVAGNYSIMVSNKYKFYQANIPGAQPSQCLDATRLSGRPINWGDPIQPGHDDTRHFLTLKGAGGANKIIMTSDGGFHISSFNYTVSGGYAWQTERANSRLNNLEIYNLAGTNSVVNFGTQHNSLAALRLNLSVAGPALELGEGYVISRQGMGDVDPRCIIYDNKYGLSVQGPAFATPPVSICGTADPFWNSPTRSWGNPIWVGNRIYIQDAAPVPGQPGVFPWKISMDNGCSWQSLPDGDTIRKGANAQFSVRNQVEQNLYVGLTRDPGVKLGKLINPHIRSAARWQYPAMNGMDGGIAFIGAEFYYIPVFCVNPTNPDHIFALEFATGKLKVSNNGGNDWEDATAFNRALTIPNSSSFKSSNGAFSIRSMKFSPYDPNIILVGTGTEGLLLSRNGGRSWERITSPGLFNITDFHWRSAGSIIISTYSHGLFYMTI